MGHPLHKVTSFKFVGQFTLQVRFDDGTEQTIDFKPVLKGELFGPLADPEFFRQVALDDEAHTLLWPNGADFDPSTLHDWHDHKGSLEEMARLWDSAKSEDADAMHGQTREGN